MMTLHELRWAYATARAAVYAVLLVLLSMLDASVGVHVFQPSIRNGRPYAVRNDDVTVTLRADGTVFAGNAWTRPEKLAGELRWLRDHNPRSRLVLRADRNAPFAAVRNAVRAARESGWPRMTIECQPPMLLLERRIRAGFVLPRRDDSRLIERETGGGSFSLDHMWR
jgi:biopolymer transport protein ExbD